MLNSASRSCTKIEPHLPLHHVAKLEWLYSGCYRFYQHLAMLQRVPPTTGLHHVNEPAVSKVFSQGTLLHEHPSVYRRGRIHLQHTEDLATKTLHHSSAAHQRQLTFRAHSLAKPRRDRSRASVAEFTRSRLLASTLSPPSSLATCICYSYSK